MGRKPVEGIAGSVVAPLPMLKEWGYLDICDYIADNTLGGTLSLILRINRTLLFVFLIKTPKFVRARSREVTDIEK